MGQRMIGLVGLVGAQISGNSDDLWLDELRLKPHAQP
jgi:hypothetical protein